MGFFSLFTLKKEVLHKLTDLEKKVASLEKSLLGTEKRIIEHCHIPPPAKEVENKDASSTSIKIEHLQVDQIIVEQLDYANNFGQLGIRDLSGKLNIGTSFEGDLSKAVAEKMQTKLQKQAKVNVRARKD